MPITTERPVKVSKRSGFDKTYRNTFTAYCGTLVPALIDEVPGNSKLSLKINAAAVLPPLVSDTYMNVRLRFEAFAIPHRLLVPNWDEFYSDFAEKYIQSGSSGYVPLNDRAAAVPLIRLYDRRVDSSGNIPDFINTGNQTLADYLGFNPPDGSSGQVGDVIDKCSLPFVLYHLVWQEWYRNPRVQRPAFARLSGSRMDVSSSVFYAVSAIYRSFYFGDGDVQPTICAENLGGSWSSIAYRLADNTSILDLRQRNFGLDFFTSAMPDPQLGPAVRVSTNVEGEEADSFSIASLRAQNSLQQFRDRNGLTSPRYQQQVYARTGAAPSDGMLQRPALIGVASYDVYSHGVSQNSPLEPDPPVASAPNPFSNMLGNRAGNGFAGGSDMLIESFHAKEPMYILVMCSLVPDVSYSQVLNPVLRRYIGKGSVTDIANDILQNVGPEPIYNEDVYLAEVGASQRGVFAYTDRYSSWMIRTNEIHGKFKYGQNLSAFVLQRHFIAIPEFGSEFLEIPTDYLDDVLAASSRTLGFSYWVDMLLEWKVSMPLQEYAIPTLQDPGYEHGKTIYLRRNGQLL